MKLATIRHGGGTGAVRVDGRSCVDLGYGMRMPGIAERVEAAIGAAFEALGQEEFNTAFKDGQRLSLEEVTAVRLGESHPHRTRGR